MPRPRRDGSPPAAPRKFKFTDRLIAGLKPQARPYLVWDTGQPRLVLLIQPSGHRAFKFIYSRQGRPRWHHLGDGIAVEDARRLAAKVNLKVLEGADPQAERRAERGSSTFAELASRYVEEHAKKRNRSWKQADALVRKHLLPRWGKLQADSISRTDVKGIVSRIDAPVVGNQVLAAASAIFSWAIREDILKLNPCAKIQRHSTTSRERVLSDAEVPLFWKAFDELGLLEGTALKLICLLGQRPNEICCMQRSQIVDGWWTLPGEPIAPHWPGTKNKHSHKVFLPAAVCALIAELDEHGSVFATARGKPIARASLSNAMQEICAKLGAPRTTPHDLRRTHLSTITGLGFGRATMDRVANHRTSTVTDVYDRYSYLTEDKRVMEAVASRIMLLVDGTDVDNVVTFGRTAS